MVNNTVDSLLSQYFANVQIVSREITMDLNRESVEIVAVRYPVTGSIGYLYFYLNDLNRPLDVLPVLPNVRRETKKAKEKREKAEAEAKAKAEAEAEESDDDERSEGSNNSDDSDDDGAKRKKGKHEKGGRKGKQGKGKEGKEEKRKKDKRREREEEDEDEDDEIVQPAPKPKRGKKGKAAVSAEEEEHIVIQSPTSTIQDSEVIQFGADGGAILNTNTNLNNNDSGVPRISHHRAFEDSKHVSDSSIGRVIDQSFTRLLLYFQNKNAQLSEVDREQFASIIGQWSMHYPGEQQEALDLIKSVERHRQERIDKFNTFKERQKKQKGEEVVGGEAAHEIHLPARRQEPKVKAQTTTPIHAPASVV